MRSRYEALDPNLAKFRILTPALLWMGREFLHICNLEARDSIVQAGLKREDGIYQSSSRAEKEREKEG